MIKTDLSPAQQVALRYDLTRAAYEALVALCEHSNILVPQVPKNTLIACERLRAELFQEMKTAQRTLAGFSYDTNPATNENA